MLNDLGGWPVLTPDWDPENFNWIELTAQLRLYNHNILISEWIGPLNDVVNGDRYIIQVIFDIYIRYICKLGCFKKTSFWNLIYDAPYHEISSKENIFPILKNIFGQY